MMKADHTAVLIQDSKAPTQEFQVLGLRTEPSVGDDTFLLKIIFKDIQRDIWYKTCRGNRVLNISSWAAERKNHRNVRFWQGTFFS